MWCWGCAGPLLYLWKQRLYWLLLLELWRAGAVLARPHSAPRIRSMGLYWPSSAPYIWGKGLHWLPAAPHMRDKGLNWSTAAQHEHQGAVLGPCCSTYEGQGVVLGPSVRRWLSRLSSRKSHIQCKQFPIIPYWHFSLFCYRFIYFIDIAYLFCIPSIYFINITYYRCMYFSYLLHWYCLHLLIFSENSSLMITCLRLKRLNCFFFFIQLYIISSDERKSPPNIKNWYTFHHFILKEKVKVF